MILNKLDHDSTHTHDNDFGRSVSGLKPDFLFWNDYFPQFYIDKLLDIVDQQETEEARINPVSMNPLESINNLRKSRVVLLNHPLWNDPNLRLIYLETLSIIQQANMIYNFDLNLGSHEVQLTKYSEQGSFYDWHQDGHILFKSRNGHPQRKLSCTILLKEAEEGGVFDTRVGTHGYNHKPGSIIVFPSFLEHMVTPIIKGERISIVSWTCGPEWK